MRATIPIALQPNTKVLRIERVVGELVSRCTSCQQWTDANGDNPNGTWRIWLNANYNFTLGTQLVLYDDGRIENVTQNEDGTESIFEVKPVD